MAEQHEHVKQVREALIEDGYSEGHVMSVLALAALVTGTHIPDGFAPPKTASGYGKGAKDMLTMRLVLDTGMDSVRARRVVKDQLTRASAAMKHDQTSTQ